MNTAAAKNKIHLAFEISIILKGLHAVLEIIGGTLVFFITKTYILTTVLFITQEELSEDPKDVISHYLIGASNNFSISSQHFIAFYLLSHGLIKLFLTVNLFKKKLWAYPTSIVVFGLFILYQLYRFSSTHSIVLLFLTAFDVVIILLTLREYRYIKES